MAEARCSSQCLSMVGYTLKGFAVGFPIVNNNYLISRPFLFLQEDEEVEEVTDLSNSDVTTKYQEAAKIANFALEGVIQQCVPGNKIVDICIFGDTVIQAVSVSTPECCVSCVCVLRLFVLKIFW